MAQKCETPPVQSTDNESVSGHVSALSSQAELSKLEQHFATVSVSLLCFTLFFCAYDDAGFLMEMFQQIKVVQYRADTQSRREHFKRTGNSVQSQ